MKQFIKTVYKNAKFLFFYMDTERGYPIAVVLFGGSLMWGLVEIASPTFEWNKATEINTWVNSFLVGMVVFTFVDNSLNQLPFIKSHALIKILLSFAASTVVSSVLSYKIKATITRLNWIEFAAWIVLGFFCLIFGLWFGKEIGDKKRKKIKEKNEKEAIKKFNVLPDEIKKEYVNYFKVLGSDEETFNVLSGLDFSFYQDAANQCEEIERNFAKPTTNIDEPRDKKRKRRRKKHKSK